MFLHVNIMSARVILIKARNRVHGPWKHGCAFLIKDSVTVVEGSISVHNKWRSLLNKGVFEKKKRLIRCFKVVLILCYTSPIAATSHWTASIKLFGKKIVSPE